MCFPARQWRMPGAVGWAVIAVAFVLNSWASPRAAAARTVRVGYGHPISTALASAGPSDTVRVGPGTYREAIELPPGVILLGAGQGRTVLTQPRGQALVIRTANGGASNCVSQVSHLTIRDAATGILIEGGAPVITDCRIEDCRFFGVNVTEGSNAELRRIKLRGNGTGVLVDKGSRPLISDCDLRGNKIALRVNGASPKVAASEISGNDVGILVESAGKPALGDRPGQGNRIHRNRRANLRNETAEVVRARYNFWGDTRCGFLRGFKGPVLFLPFMNLALEDSVSTCPESR